ATACASRPSSRTGASNSRTPSSCDKLSPDSHFARAASTAASRRRSSETWLKGLLGGGERGVKRVRVYRARVARATSASEWTPAAGAGVRTGPPSPLGSGWPAPTPGRLDDRRPRARRGRRRETEEAKALRLADGLGTRAPAPGHAVPGARADGHQP